MRMIVQTLVISLLVSAGSLHAAEGQKDWIRCTEGVISAIAFSDSDPLVLVGSRSGEVVAVKLAEFAAGDPVCVPGRVVSLQVDSAHGRWFAGSIDQEQFVVTAGSIDSRGKLASEYSRRIGRAAEGGYLVLAPRGDYLATVIVPRRKHCTIQVFSVPEWSPVFSAADLHQEILVPFTVGGNFGSRGPARPRVAFFGDGRFAFASTVNPRSSSVGLVDLQTPEDVVRMTIRGRALSVMPSLCGTTFCILYDRLGKHGGIIDRFTGQTSRPWRRVVAFPSPRRLDIPQRWFAGETDCDGSFAVVKFVGGSGVKRHFQLVRVSPTGSSKLVERVRYGHEFSAPIIEIGKEQQRLVFFEPGANRVEVIDLTQGSLVQSHATEFEIASYGRLGLAGEGSRFAVLTHFHRRRPESENRDQDPRRIYVVDLGKPDEASAIESRYE